ncbi:MAG: hypothetical protein B6I20_05010 [Bacteroidetes bacterium 4572_117]|nr:MAG: hypothetical protein B6I20_05010 [Bacteroidetes bacterium 4572_117]
MLILPVFASAQVNPNELAYRRSSLYTLMINEPDRPYAKEIKKAYISSEIPDKFNNHLLGSRAINNAVGANIRKKEEKIRIQRENINRYMVKNKVAKALVAKWFNRSANGTFNMELIAQRGSYNATDMDVAVAKSSKRGLALLADAGEELIKNTFVIVNDFHYVNKEEVANKVKSGLAFLKDIAELVDENIDTDFADETLTTFGKGYVIRTRSYLYQLEWNDSVAAVFYDEHWMDEQSYDRNKEIAFEQSDIFKLKLVGFEVAWADLQSTIYTKKTEEELITVATIRAVDAVIAKLQRKYEVFRTKTPLYSANPISAKIGLKEGLKKGDKFEVLEQVADKSGRTRYKRKGVIKVDKNNIWDNRFMATEEQNSIGNMLEYSLFKGGKNYYKGMLIRQIN